MADRLSVDKKYVEDVIKSRIDKVDALKLKSEGERADIFMLALALGVKEGYRTKSHKKEGLILESAAKGKDLCMSFIYSVAINELRKTNEENKISDKDVVYTIAEEYANTGFRIMEDFVPDCNNYKEEDLVFSLIERLDEIYEDIIIK